MNITPQLIDQLLRQLGVEPARAGAVRTTDGGIEAEFRLPYMTERVKLHMESLRRWDAQQLFDQLHASVECLQANMLAHLRKHTDVRDSDIDAISAQADKLVKVISEHLGKLVVPYDVGAAIALEAFAFKDLITRVREGRQRLDVRHPDEGTDAKAEPAVSETRTMIPRG